MNSNLALLTRAHGAVAAKRRARREQIKEVVFDDDARREFLTGFHKRKLAKAETARAKAKEREKQDRLEARRDQRRMLREQAITNSSQVEKAYGAITDTPDADEDDEPEWDGISPSDAHREDEYEDEEHLATVTVIEDFDPDTIIHGPPKTNEPTASSSSSSHPPPTRTTTATTPSASSSKRPSKPKVRERKVRYETKDARKREQVKQRKRRTEKAERAGGKASRKPSGAGKKHGARH